MSDLVKFGRSLFLLAYVIHEKDFERIKIFDPKKIRHQTSLNQKLSTISPLPASKSFTQFRNTLTHKGLVFRQGIIV